ncbi:CLUMA_CG005251, isoform A [Clunio marinus]|uniref:CLUMA_CG005251, isoform A n=1 Tax=Clunio marinus TaxID=568069 RepID=A0A1J1HUB6_9DIPT|nr:CLUMA_CG005251, isoform A [Clunio marinus]
MINSRALTKQIKRAQQNKYRLVNHNDHIEFITIGKKRKGKTIKEICNINNNNDALHHSQHNIR